MPTETSDPCHSCKEKMLRKEGAAKGKENSLKLKGATPNLGTGLYPY